MVTAMLCGKCGDHGYALYLRKIGDLFYEFAARCTCAAGDKYKHIRMPTIDAAISPWHKYDPQAVSSDLWKEAMRLQTPQTEVERDLIGMC